MFCVCPCSACDLVLSVSLFLQGFELDYSRSDALRTRKIIRNAVIDVIDKGRRKATEWNVKIVYKSPERRKPVTKRHRRVRKKVTPKLVDNG